MIANDVVAKLADSKVLEMAEAVNPGFINLKYPEHIWRSIWKR